MSPRADEMKPFVSFLYGASDLFGPEKERSVYNRRGAPRKHVRGFPFNSTLVFSGAAGVEKTTFALALLRDLMRQDRNARLYYISTDCSQVDLRRRYRKFSWFTEQDSIFSDRVEVYAVPEVDMPLPVQGAADLLNPTFSELRHWASSIDNTTVFVLIDSLTGLVKDSRGPGELRRNISEVLERLGKSLPGQLGLTFLMSDIATDVRGLSFPEADLADYVFHFALRNTGRSRRLRTVECLKSPGSEIILGEQTWAILKSDSLSQVIALRPLRNRIRRLQGTTPDSKALPEPSSEWTTVAIFTRPQLPEIGRVQNWVYDEPAYQTSGNNLISTGTPGLDEMLRGSKDYWARPISQLLRSPRRSQLESGLLCGSTTLVLGRSGAGKTIACLQFLLAGANKSRSLYVTFEHPPQRVLRWFPASAEVKRSLRLCQTLYRRHTNLDVNLLYSELKFAILSLGIERIAIDGLSGATLGMDAGEFARFIEDLASFMRQASVELRRSGKHATSGEGIAPITIFIAVETDVSSEGMLNAAAYSLAADNVLVLQQLRINDEQRKGLWILKARGSDPDRQVREMSFHSDDQYPLRILPGLENYAGLLTGQPAPVSVTLHLFSENPAETAFNRWFNGHLKSVFGYRLRDYSFSRGDIFPVVQDVTASIARVPRSDVTLMSVDEWWIRELRVIEAKNLNADPYRVQHPLLILDAFLLRAFEETASDSESRFSSDFWIFEIEKGSVPLLTSAATSQRGTSNSLSLSAPLVACPGYLDFSMFCVQRDIMSHFVTVSPATPDKPTHDDARALRQSLPRVLAIRTSDNWFEAPDASQSRCLVDLMKRVVDRSSQQLWGFACDMENPVSLACAFLELAWACGGTEDFLIRDVMSFSQRDESQRRAWLQDHPAVVALKLLQFLVVERLMPKRPVIDDTGRSLFSRHWYSTFTQVDTAKVFQSGEPPATDDKAGSSALCAIPFFPLGAVLPGSDGKRVALANALQDTLSRYERLLLRLEAACEYRRQTDGMADSLDIVPEQIKDVIEYRERLNAAGEKPDQAVCQDITTALRNHHTVILQAVLSSRLLSRGVGVRRKHLDPQFQPSYPWPKEEDSQPRLWRRLPAAMFLDLRDALELLRWHDFRVRLLQAELWGHTLSDVVENRQPSGQDSDNLSIRALTGYSSEGSWMMAVHQDTHAPLLAGKYLAEASSYTCALKRAEIGAGIPARKDFYEAHGLKTAKWLEGSKMTWNDLLCYAGARGRRRDRVFCNRIMISPIVNCINRLVIHSLAVADTLAVYYGLPQERQQAIDELVKLAESSIDEMFTVIQSAMRNSSDSAGKSAAHPCLVCPLPSSCREILAPRPD